MTDYGRGHDSLRVGLLGITGAIAFTALFVYSTNRTLGAERSTVYVRISAADGLQKGDAVLHRGVKVGEVRSIDFGGAGVIVRARLHREVPLTGDARAEMVAADMFGRQTLVLHDAVGHGGRPLLDGDTLDGAGPVSLTARIEALGGQVDALLSDSTIGGLHRLLDGAGSATVEAGSALSDIGRLARNADHLLGDQRAALDTLGRELAGAARNLRDMTDPEELAVLRERIEATTARIESAVANVEAASATMAAMLAGLEEGRGTAGRLLSDEALYERAVGALSALERLIDDLRENPGRYVTIKIF